MGFQRFLLLLAAFAAVTQWSIPHGWMLAPSPQGSAMLTPCPSTSPALAALAGAGLAEAHHHHNHGKTKPHTSTKPDHAGRAMHAGHGAHAAMAHDAEGEADHASSPEALCDFAALAAPALLPVEPQLALWFFTHAPRPKIAWLTAPGRGLAAPPPPSTGPPSLI